MWAWMFMKMYAGCRVEWMCRMFLGNSYQVYLFIYFWYKFYNPHIVKKLNINSNIDIHINISARDTIQCRMCFTLKRSGSVNFWWPWLSVDGVFFLSWLQIFFDCPHLADTTSGKVKISYWGSKNENCRFTS